MVEPASALERRMSLAEYLALPDDLHAEYVDGVALVTPPPSFTHQKICQRLVGLLEAALRGVEVVAGAGWRLPAPGERVRIPDLMILDEAPEGPLVAKVPLVVVEVLSTNRSDDLVRKSTEYLNAGVGQYWIVDPRDAVIDVFANSARGWQPLARLTEDDPEAIVDVAGHGEVRLSLAQVLKG